MQRREKEQTSPSKKSDSKSTVKKETAKKNVPDTKSAPAKKLSYNDQRELKNLPQKIEKLEAEISELQAKMGEPEYYQKGGDKIAEDAKKLKQSEEDLLAAFARWEELEQ